MHDMMVICRTTYGRILRNRSLYVLLLAALVLVACAHLYPDLTAGRHQELMYDLGGALLLLAGLLSALVVTLDIARDLREKVVMTLLSKPLGRSQYLLGKFLGVVWVGTVALGILTVGTVVIIHLETDAWRADFLQVALSTWGVMVLATAVGLLFASFLPEIPAALLTLVVYGIGQATEPLALAKSAVAHLVFSLLPNFCLLDVKTELSNGLSISWLLVVAAVAYALIYSAALVSLANILFHRRDLA
jgi:ABC-type transport system involved in multi-copper enzyme maturation permease subunit